MVTDPQTGTNVHEVADGIYRINTPIALPGAMAFNFNQYLLVDDEPLLFHTGPRQLFAARAPGGRLRDAGRAAALRRVLARRGRRMRLDQRLAARRHRRPRRCAVRSRRWSR